MRRSLPLQAQRRSHAQHESLLHSLLMISIRHRNRKLKFPRTLRRPVQQPVVLQLDSRWQRSLLQLPMQIRDAALIPNSQRIRRAGKSIGQVRIVLNHQPPVVLLRRARRRTVPAGSLACILGVKLPAEPPAEALAGTPSTPQVHANSRISPAFPRFPCTFFIVLPPYENPYQQETLLS